MNGESKGARVASGDLKMRCILKRLTEPTGESSALWYTTLLAKSIPNKTVRMGGAGNGSRKDQGLHMKVDTTAIEQEIAAYEKQLRQHYSTKSRLMEEIDSLDPDDRLYKMYDKIEEVENGLMDARAKKQSVEADKITGDNIYKILICFDKLYATMTEAERRRLVEILIDEVQIYPERQPNGQWLKSVRFKLPIIDHDLELSLDNKDRVETVCALSKLDIHQKITVDLKMDELDVTAAETKATYEEIREYVKEHTGLNVSDLYIAQVKQKCGIKERQNYNKPKAENPKRLKCPAEKERAIREALKYFKMI